jgi:hypothetical protein
MFPTNRGKMIASINVSEGFLGPQTASISEGHQCHPILSEGVSTEFRGMGFTDPDTGRWKKLKCFTKAHSLG